MNKINNPDKHPETNIIVSDGVYICHTGIWCLVPGRHLPAQN